MYRSSFKWDSTTPLILCGDDANPSFVSCNIEKRKWGVKSEGSSNLWGLESISISIPFICGERTRKRSRWQIKVMTDVAQCHDHYPLLAFHLFLFLLNRLPTATETIYADSTQQRWASWMHTAIQGRLEIAKCHFLLSEKTLPRLFQCQPCLFSFILTKGPSKTYELREKRRGGLGNEITSNNKGTYCIITKIGRLCNGFDICNIQHWTIFPFIF